MYVVSNEIELYNEEEMYVVDLAIPLTYTFVIGSVWIAVVGSTRALAVTSSVTATHTCRVSPAHITLAVFVLNLAVIGSTGMLDIVNILLHVHVYTCRYYRSLQQHCTAYMRSHSRSLLGIKIQNHVQAAAKIAGKQV